MSDSHRTDRVQLAADKARCEPTNPCPQRQQCARYRALVPPYGSMMGHDMPSSWDPGNCYHFISVDGLRTAAPAAAPKRVHDAPKGLL